MSTTQLTREQWNPALRFATLERFPGYRFAADGSIWSAHVRSAGRACVIGDAWRKLSIACHGGHYAKVRLKSAAGEIVQGYVHRLIAEAFLGPPPAGFHVRHFNENDITNNAIENLRYGTCEENCADKRRHGTLPKGERHGKSRFTAETVRDIRRRFSQGETLQSIADDVGGSVSNASAIVTRKTWAWLADEVSA